jgi:hypothetical protein
MYLRVSLILLVFFFLGGGVWAQNKAEDEITLEVNTVQIILNDEHRSGVDWGAIVSDFHTALLRKEDDTAWDEKKYRLSFGTVSQDDYAVLLEALDTVGRMSQFPQTPVKALIGMPIGISLEKQNILVNARWTRLKSGDISLSLEPHAALLVTEFHDGRRVPVSVLLKTQTNLTVVNNATVVIGGLMKEEEITRTRKLPLLGDIRLLGDIPFFGLVFRSQGRLMQKTETIIFLTVRMNAGLVPQADNPS